MTTPREESELRRRRAQSGIRRESRASKRAERRMIARELGFSPAQADRMRDLSPQRFEDEIRAERARITRTSRARRTAEQQSRLDSIREYSGQSEITRQRRLATGGTRYENFRMWSSKYVGFPDAALDGDDFFPGITAMNRRAGRNDFDGFGYRAFYYYYVERIMDIDVIAELADRGDSGVRGVTIGDKLSGVRRGRAA